MIRNRGNMLKTSFLLETITIYGIFVWPCIALIGIFIGYILSKKVRGRHMAIGSAVYWTISLINLYYFSLYYYHNGGLYQNPTVSALSVLILISMFLVLFLNVAYIAGKYMHRR
jgi:hypothetical protein